jgi:hypothetical protein
MVVTKLCSLDENWRQLGRSGGSIREVWWLNREAWWFNGSAPDCCPAVPGSNLVSPQPTADCQCAGELPPGMALGCGLTFVRGNRGENYEKWTTASLKTYKEKKNSQHWQPPSLEVATICCDAIATGPGDPWLAYLLLDCSHRLALWPTVPGLAWAKVEAAWVPSKPRCVSLKENLFSMYSYSPGEYLMMKRPPLLMSWTMMTTTTPLHCRLSWWRWDNEEDDLAGVWTSLARDQNKAVALGIQPSINSHWRLPLGAMEVSWAVGRRLCSSPGWMVEDCLKGVCQEIFWVLFCHVWIDLGLYKNLRLFLIFSVEPLILTHRGPYTYSHLYTEHCPTGYVFLIELCRC